MDALNTDLKTMQAKLKEVERLAHVTRKLAKETLDVSKQLLGHIAEFHAGSAHMIIKHGPAAGLTDDQIQPLSGNEGKEDPPTVP